MKRVLASILALCLSIGMSSLVYATECLDSSNPTLPKVEINCASSNPCDAGAYGKFSYDVKTGSVKYTSASQYKSPTTAESSSIEDFSNDFVSSRANVNDIFKISNPHTNSYRRICVIQFKTKSGKNAFGTGFVVGPNAIATAGHVLYNDFDLDGTNEWAQDVTVYPGVSFPTEPYKNLFGKAANLHIGGEWASNKNVNDDWGLIEVDEPIGDETGTVTLDSNDNAFGMRNRSVRIAGYPVERMLYPEGVASVMYGAYGKITFAYTRSLPWYNVNIKAYGGMSGSPCYDTDTGKVIGILTMGDNTMTKFMQINTWLYNAFNEYR